MFGCLILVFAYGTFLGERLPVERGSVIAQALQNAASSLVAPPEELVTLVEFNSIHTGMTYQQVVGIIGAEGTLTSEQAFEGFGNVGGWVSQNYGWKGSGLTNSHMSGSFNNGKLTGKSQWGLR